MTKREEIRQQIIDAAASRFARFGYGKTSMAEIASDCGMSPGNVYRYFENKLDVAECICRRVFNDTLRALEDAVAQHNANATQKIRTFVLTELEYTYHLLDRYPTLLDQAQEVRAKRPLCVDEYRSAARNILAAIMREGVDNNEFDIDNCDTAARMFHAATLKFRYPQLHSSLTLARLEREAQDAVDLLLNGIRKRR